MTVYGRNRPEWVKEPINWVYFDALNHLDKKAVFQDPIPDFLFFTMAVNGSNDQRKLLEKAPSFRVNTLTPLALARELAYRKPSAKFVYFNSVYSLVKKHHEDQRQLDYYVKSKRKFSDLASDLGLPNVVDIFLGSHESFLRKSPYFTGKLIQFFNNPDGYGTDYCQFDNLDFYWDFGCAKQFMRTTIENVVWRTSGQYRLSADRCFHVGRCLFECSSLFPALRRDELDLARFRDHKPYRASLELLHWKSHQAPKVLRGSAKSIEGAEIFTTILDDISNDKVF